MLADRVGVMSARPGRFIEIVATDWPRDRDSRIVSDARFGAVTAHLWELLREQSLRALGHSNSADPPQFAHSSALA
jgi:NitT/TauT family transport system ATP-binding protein